MERKRREVHEHIQIKPFKRSELRRVYEIISSDGQSELEIETQDFKYASFEELIASDAAATEIEMMRKDPVVHIRLSRGHVIFHGGPEDLAIGIAAQLKDFFSEYKRSEPPTVLFIAAGTVIGVGGLAKLTGHMSRAATAVVASICLAVILSVIISLGRAYFYTLDNKQPIAFKPEKGGTINWRSAAWDIGKIIIGAMVGSAVTLLASRFQK